MPLCANRPTPIPAKSMCGSSASITSARTSMSLFSRPGFNALQLSPLSVLLKTPSPNVPAYRVSGLLGSIARATTVPGTPGVISRQLSAPLVLL